MVTEPAQFSMYSFQKLWILSSRLSLSNEVRRREAQNNGTTLEKERNIFSCLLAIFSIFAFAPSLVVSLLVVDASRTALKRSVLFQRRRRQSLPLNDPP
jgi:hypothetical protein